MALQSTTALSTITLTEAAPSVTFSNIPQGYRDLVLVASKIGTTTVTIDAFRVNGDSGSNYAHVVAEGNGSAASSYAATTTSGRYTRVTAATGTSASGLRLDFLDYSATDKHKSVLCRNDNSASGTTMSAVRWANTSAITSIEILTLQDGFAAGSTFSLYGRIA